MTLLELPKLQIKYLESNVRENTRVLRARSGKFRKSLGALRNTEYSYAYTIHQSLFTIIIPAVFEWLVLVGSY